MADTHTTPAEQDPPNMAPLLPEEDLLNSDDDSDLEVEPAEVNGDDNDEPPRQPRWKQTRRGRPSREQTERQRQTREMTLEEWLVEMDNKFGWDRPGVTCELHRLYPRSIDGIPSAGLVEEKVGACYTMAEVLDRFGGGTYEMKMIAPHDVYGKPPRTSKKRFDVSGKPKISDKQADAARTGTQQDISGDRAIMTMVYKQQQDELNRLRNRDHSVDFRPYEQSVETVRTAANTAAQARIEAADRIAAEKERQAAEARQELDRMTHEMRRMEDDARRKIEEATANSSNLLGALLPTFSNNATEQVRNITKQFEAREARIEASHAQELRSQATFFQTQMAQQQTSFDAQLARLEATWIGQKNLLEGQLQHYQLQNAQLTQLVEALRNELMNIRMQQVETLQKDRDPVEQVTKLAGLKDILSDLGLGGGGGGDDGDLGEGASPVLKFLNNAVSNIGPAVQAAFNRGQGGGVPPGMPPMIQHPQTGQMMVHPAYAQQMAAQQNPAAPPAAPEPPPAPKVKIKVSELRALVAFVTQARRAGTTAKQVATVALQHPEVDRQTLKILVQKPKDKVLSELAHAGVLEDTDATDREFIGELLSELAQVV